MIGSPNFLFPEPLGAIERYVYGLSKELSKKIYVSVSGFGSGEEKSGTFSLKTYSSRSFMAFSHFPEERLRGMSCGAIHNAYAFRDILRVHKKRPIDIIHANTIYSVPIATVCKIALGIPFVCSVHNELLTAQPFCTCDRVLPVSNYLRRFISQKSTLSDRMDVLPDAIDTSAYNATTSIEEAKKELGLSNRKIILFVGRKCPEKGPQVLVEALQSVAKCYSDVLGVFLGPDNYFGSQSSSYTERLLAQARRCEVEKNLLFKGYVSEHELRLYYSAADVFACPSIWNEPFGMVLLEALSYRKPVVASKVGGIPEIIKDGKTGFLFSPGNSQELAEAIVRLLNNPVFGEDLGANGRRLVEAQFSFEAVGSRCLEIYKKVLSA
jgi:glycosyltransferase involved in cell wall biosynthesis